MPSAVRAYSGMGPKVQQCPDKPEGLQLLRFARIVAAHMLAVTHKSADGIGLMVG